MRAYTIILKHSAIADLDAFRKYDHHPTKESKSRIKRLRGIGNPDYRLRVGDYRVFCVVDEDARQVDALRVMHKDQTLTYYKELK